MVNEVAEEENNIASQGLDSIDLALKDLIIQQAETEDDGLNAWDRIRLIAQGLSLNSSDEATAFARSFLVIKLMMN